MKQTMKKLAILLMALVLALPWTLAMAEETAEPGQNEALSAAENMTVKAEISIDKEAASRLLTDTLGIPEEQAGILNSIIALLDALSEDVIYADNGLEMNTYLNDSNVYSMSAEVTDEDFRIVSSLFPNCVLTVSPETIMEYFQNMAYLTYAGSQEESQEELDMNSEMNAAAEALAGYLTQFIDSCVQAVGPGQAEEAEFTYKGVTFNTKVPVVVDADAIASAEEEMVAQILTDENIAPFVDMIAQMSGMDVDSLLEANSEMMSEEHLPDVDAAMYFISDEDGNVGETFCVVSESTYKDAEAPSFRYTFLSQGQEGAMTLEMADLNMTMDFAYRMQENGLTCRLDYDMQGMYIGYGMDVVMNENQDVVMTSDLFLMDAVKPLSSSTVTISKSGERTASADGEGKKVVALEDLMNGSEEATNGLLNDIMMYGLGNLFTSVTEAVPEAKPLIDMITGAADTSTGT